MRLTGHAPRDGEEAGSASRARVGRWAAWGGAFVVVVAMGFLAKLAIDEGWWGSLPVLVRHVRASMVEVLHAPFIRAARAHGVPRGRLLFRQPLQDGFDDILYQSVFVHRSCCPWWSVAPAS